VAFRGWPAEAIEFFDRLEIDNTKDYWTAHKDVYERAVRGPMQELLDELAPRYGAGRIFRPYRDVRFSKDKTPYKTNIAAMVGDAGYVSLSAAGLGVGAGTYQMDAVQLDRYRRSVVDDRRGAALEAIVAELRAGGHECGTHGELKTAPRGYPKDHPRLDLLRAKGLTAWHEWPPQRWLATAKAKDRVVDVIEAAAPLKAWLAEHVGDPG
jgi:uncharacterized protein (TIGR02453 family)